MADDIAGYVPLTDDLARLPLGASVAVGDLPEPRPDLRTVAPDLVTTGVAVVANAPVAEQISSADLVVAGERRMLHHLASAADVEIPVRLLAPASTPREDVDAILATTTLQVLLAVS
ncbi:hypothetical protein [Mobilicoccus pelagius]|uniref:Uncharacterized protein n=1 Tax=Mobilicoccus pelagius NBRC 104925 TaxID=1089455 RepID=H5UPB9_9MICO|nr:hypothetical protein [Mobilicoccus pelagius]GAB47577.1 hypothetical protein MOPEL_021_00130 [Mobilicoccus pelagius NBRC 104925]